MIGSGFVGKEEKEEEGEEEDVKADDDDDEDDDEDEEDEGDDEDEEGGDSRGCGFSLRSSLSVLNREDVVWGGFFSSLFPASLLTSSPSRGSCLGRGTTGNRTSSPPRGSCPR